MHRRLSNRRIPTSTGRGPEGAGTHSRQNTRERLASRWEFADPSVFEKEQFKPNSDGHIFLLHEDEIRPLAAKAGLKVEAIRLSTNFLTNGFVKTEPLLKILPRGLVQAVENFTCVWPLALQKKINTSMAVLFKK